MPRALSASLVGVVLVMVLGSSVVAQESECPVGPPLLSAADPIYPDAMELAQELQSHGFVIRCIFPTKAGSIFRVDENGAYRNTIEGETCFRTSLGDIDVFFLPKPQTFADFHITERRKDRGYLYRFTGTPRVWYGDKFMFGTALRQSFFKRDNKLFLVNHDGELRPRLESAMHLQP